MELVFAVLIICLAAIGLSLGLILGGRAPRTACDGLSCLPDSRCAGCPRRRKDP